MKLMKGAQFMASDSAFNQLESYLMGLPYLALRDHTEQIEGLDRNVVLAKNSESIMKQFLNNYRQYRTKPISDTSKPSRIIVNFLMNEK